MTTAKQHKIVDKMSAELFLKKILSMPYEVMGMSRVFYVVDKIESEEVAGSSSVTVCHNVEEFKRELEEGSKSNLQVSRNLINEPLLRDILQSSSQTKNILWSDL